MTTRRSFHALVLSSLACGARGAWAGQPAGTLPVAARNAALDELARLERLIDGRLGVCIVDTASGEELGRRADERFQMLSTFKLLAAGFVLARHDRGEDSLDRRIRYTRQDLVNWSPVTGKHVGDRGMTLAELCHATVTTSDNTAANLILRSFGGPEALTRFIRGLGDGVTRCDRYEPELNVPHATGMLDTTTPHAITRTLGRLTVGEALSPESRERLQAWLVGNTTGDKRLRAGIPAGWRIGEKTGTYSKVGANDIGLAWPPARPAILMSVYVASTRAPDEVKEQVIAKVAELAGRLYGRPENR
ncbi:class A beta-lactamase [Pigmentiphaga sp. GD03639]|uniref:class A beta-lactamase n=1 Tax=Pigmentiphaga sp. GD03639 TaxID=2975354 RepID=UPI002446B8A3|nr:class A beta-lactamase [Pigmentiphaga sp. GD03639]MDH2238344.1 class A beta-lactamase [Pigmentiphaga sp. GD03639]